MNMDLSTANAENTPMNILSDKMKTLQVPDVQQNNPTPTCHFFKDGKLYFQEPKLRAENHFGVVEKITAFRQLRMNIESTPDLHQQSVEIPSAFTDLIAVLVQDSDEPCTVLTSRINDILSPFMRNENTAHKFDLAIEKTIKQVGRKVTYGLKQEVYAKIEHTAPNIPWHLSITRWEVDNIEMFPMDMQQAVICRRTNRQQMTDTFSDFIYNLPPNERSTIVNTKHRRQVVYKEIISNDETKAKQPEQEKLKRKEEEEEKKKQRELQEEEKRKQREQQEEKRKQREEEKRIRDEEKKKREEEKKKKEQSQLRLTSLFAKAAVPESTSLHAEQKTKEPVKSTLFPAFYIKDHVTISHINQYTNTRPQSTYTDFKNAIQSNSANHSVQSFLTELSPESRSKRGISTRVDIRTLLLPGSADILHVPNVRLALRMKLMQFHENVRPAYYGTYTQHSRIVNGRKPFAKDQDKLDYDIDSEAEWEPEGEGEDIHSGDEDDEDPNADIIDPEDASWLVPEGYLSDNEGVEDENDQHDRNMGKSRSQNTSKRLAIRKVVLGPFFEGESEENDAMKPFETQFFMDIPDEGYNPFYKEPISRVPPATTVTPTPNTTTTPNHKIEFTDQHRDALISVINEKPKESIPSLITEAKSNWILKDVSKRQLEAKIKNIAVKEKRGTDTKPSWYIKDPSTPAQQNE